MKWAVGVIDFQLTHLKVFRWKTVEELTFKILKRLDLPWVAFALHLFVCPPLSTHSCRYCKNKSIQLLCVCDSYGGSLGPEGPSLWLPKMQQEQTVYIDTTRLQVLNNFTVADLSIFKPHVLNSFGTFGYLVIVRFVSPGSS